MAEILFDMYVELSSGSLAKTYKFAAAQLYQHKPQLIFRDFSDIKGNYEKELGVIRS